MVENWNATILNLWTALFMMKSTKHWWLLLSLISQDNPLSWIMHPPPPPANSSSCSGTSGLLYHHKTLPPWENIVGRIFFETLNILNIWSSKRFTSENTFCSFYPFQIWLRYCNRRTRDFNIAESKAKFWDIFPEP